MTLSAGTDRLISQLHQQILTFFACLQALLWPDSIPLFSMHKCDPAIQMTSNPSVVVTLITLGVAQV